MEKLDNEKIERLNGCFASVFFPLKKRAGLYRDGSRQGMVSGLLIDMDRDVVERYLAILDGCKSPGPDGVHMRELKELFRELAEPFSIILKTFLWVGVVLTKVERSECYPSLHKREDVPGFYRTVNLKSVLRKITGAAFKETNLKKYLLIWGSQQSFVPNKSYHTNQMPQMQPG